MLYEYTFLILIKPLKSIVVIQAAKLTLDQRKYLGLLISPRWKITLLSMSCLFVHRGHFLKLIKLQQFHFWHLQLTFEKQGNQILNKGKLSSWQTLIFKIQQFSEKFAWNYCVSHPLQFCFGNKAWAECLKITQKVSFYSLNFPIVISATIWDHSY